MVWYSVGTVTVTPGSPVVSGAGTAFVANVQQGDGFVVPGANVPPIEIAAVNADGQITLARGWPGTTAGGLVYTILPTQSYVHDLALAAANLLNTFAAVRDGIGQGLFPDGTVAAPGFRFLADQDTGFYRVGPNSFALVLGGVAAVTYAGAATRFASGANFLDLSITTGGVTLASSTGNMTLTVPSNGAFIWAINGASTLALSAGALYPLVDNSLPLGVASLRFSTVYAATGSINTSDERTKRWRGGLTIDELAAAKEIADSIGVFQFLDALAEKGEAARLHTGVKAQQVVSIMQAHGLDPMRYAFLCHDQWAASPAVAATPEATDRDGKITPAQPGRPAVAAGDLYAIRYDELSMFLAAAQEQRLSAIEAKLAA